MFPDSCCKGVSNGLDVSEVLWEFPGVLVIKRVHFTIGKRCGITF